MLLRNGLALILLFMLTPLMGLGQVRIQPLPRLAVNRRGDVAYMDSLARLAKERYYNLAKSPQTALNDTLRFKALYYLGDLYKWWYSRRDSSLYYGNELVSQAHKSGNLFYEINGKSLVETHYRTLKFDTPRALRLNLDILATLPPTADYQVMRVRVAMNLGDLYALAKDYTNALRYLTQAQKLLVNDLMYSTARTTNIFRAEVEQHIGAVYKQQSNFIDSETHYLAAETLLQKTPSETSQAFVYDDLGELYLASKNYRRALFYAKKAEAIWDRIKTPTESHSWGTLSCVYAGLGQDELATQYAQKVLGLPRPNKFIREQAYMALYQVAEHRQDWRNGASYYKKYIAVRDTIADDQRSLELVAIEKQADYDRFVLQSQQAQQLQAQRLLTTRKQAELNQLRADAQADALTKKAQLSEQQRRFDTRQASMRESILLSRQRTIQEAQQQALKQMALQQENQSQRTLIAYLASSFLFIVGILILLLYASQLRKRQAEADLLLTRERKDANARIIQTQESERQRIAADLHDDLGGTLATLRRRLADISLHTTDADTQRAFAEAEPLIQKSSDDLRRISHNLMPPEFARIGLRNALEQLVRHQPLQPTNFSFVTSGIDQKLPIDVELNAYRIVSELVQNINKHAQANRAAVQLLYQNDQLTITVEDDGLGNRALVNVTKSAGIGLKNSSLRAEYIGATLWRDVSEAGTLVVLDIPYPTPLYAARTSLPNSLN